MTPGKRLANMVVPRPDGEVMRRFFLSAIARVAAETASGLPRTSDMSGQLVAILYMRLPFAGGFAHDINPQRKKLSEQRGGGSGASCPAPGLGVHEITTRETAFDRRRKPSVRRRGAEGVMRTGVAGDDHALEADRAPTVCPRSGDAFGAGSRLGKTHDDGRGEHAQDRWLAPLGATCRVCVAMQIADVVGYPGQPDMFAI